MIGFYNYSVILTYIGLASAILGMTQALSGSYKNAFLCLIISGICDMFDGKVARMMTRTEHEQSFGIQIDSLCDLVCFGVFPAVIGYSFGLTKGLGILSLILYTLTAVIRLGYFNVMEIERQQQTTEVRKYYQGLPVTSVALILPMFYLTQSLWGAYFSLAYECVLLIIAFCFVLNIKVKKPTAKETYALAVIGFFVLIRILK